MRTLITVICLFLPLKALAAPKVVVDIAPLHSLVTRVMTGVATPTLLVPLGASPHDFALRPSQARDLSKADIVFWIGEGLTPWLHDPLDSLAENANQIAFLEKDRSPVQLDVREIALDDHDDEHEKHDDHAHETGHDDHHAHSGTDPHLWLSVKNAQAWVKIILDALSVADPENAAAFTTNANALSADLSELEATLSENMQRPSRHIVFHDAYHYFENAYNKEPLAFISPSEHTRPSPRRVADTRRIIAEQGIGCVLTDATTSTKLLATVSEGFDIKVHSVDPLGTGLSTGPKLYTDLLGRLGAAFADC